MKLCPQCRQPNPDQARFCVSCGLELERECHICHRVVPADARYCPYCGTPILTAPPTPWLERAISPEARLGLMAVTRGLGVTLILLAVVTVFLTPPPRMIDDALLLISGATLLVFSEVLRQGRKPKPPDDDDGGDILRRPDTPPPDGLRLVEPETPEELAELISRHKTPPGGMQGPFLN